MAERKGKARKFRSPKLTRIERLTKGLLTERDVNAIFSVKEVSGKGRGVFLRVPVLRKDSFVLEYEGDIISEPEAKYRERIYAHNNEGCFIMSFTFQGTKMAIDATRRFDSVARLLNHSREPNIRFHPPFMIDLNGGLPRIASYALKDIHKGEEIVIDYGVRDGHISWLRNREIGFTADVDSDSSDASDCISLDDSIAECETPQKTSPVRPACADNDASCSVSTDITNTETFIPARIGTQIKEWKETRQDMGSLAFNGGEYGVRFTSVVPGAPKKTYFAGFECLGVPQKIMKFIEDTSKRRKLHPESENIVCLSTCSSVSSKISEIVPSSRRQNVSLHPSSKVLDIISSIELPSNKAPDSIHKVLEWQAASSTLDSSMDLKIINVQSLSDSPFQDETTNNDNSTSGRQQNSSAFHLQEISISSCPHHVSQDDINLQKTPHNDKCSLLLPLSSIASKSTDDLVVSIDTSVSDDKSESSSLSSCSNSIIKGTPPSLASKSAVRKRILFNQSDVCVISDDECVSEPTVSEKQLKMGGEIGLMKENCSEDESSGSECEIILTDIPNSSKESGKLGRNLPARKPVGFSSPSASLQVAVIKPYVSPSSPGVPQRATVAMTELEQAQLKEIFNLHIFSNRASFQEAQQAIDRNWDFFSVLLLRGVSIDEIRATISQFFKRQM